MNEQPTSPGTHQHAAAIAEAGPHPLPIIDFDGSRWWFDDRQQQLRSIHDSEICKKLDDIDAFLIRYHLLLRELEAIKAERNAEQQRIATSGDV